MSFQPTSGFRIGTVVLRAVVCLLFGAISLFAQGEQSFKGEITQCKCPGSDSHAAMPGERETDAPCDVTCQQRGTIYVLYDAKHKVAYQLDKQKKSKAFAGQYVFIIGALDKATNTIQIDKMVRALPPKVREAKSVYIDCDACLRGMAKATPAAFEQLTAWKRFTVVTDVRKADLIFLFSANPYLGDYVTRDGPDQRLVRVEITYMNVVDPKTGENLWGDSRDWGSLRVSWATRSLIAEFGRQLDEEESLDGQR
jgi:hypothetical protein